MTIISKTDKSYVALNLELRIPNFDPRIGDEVLTRVAHDVGDRPWWFLRYWQSGPHIRFRALRREDAEIIERSVTTSFTKCATSSWKDIAVLTDREYRDATSGVARQGEGDGEMECLPLAPLGVHARPFKSEESRYGGVQRYRAAIRAFSASSVSVGLTLDSHRDMDARTRYLLGASAIANFYGRVAELANPCGTADGYEGKRLSISTLRSAPFAPAPVVTMMNRIIANPRPDTFEHVDPRLLGPTVKDVLTTENVPIRGAYLGSIIHTTCNRLGLAVEAERSLRWTALDLVEEQRRASRRD
ncbi:hypothetical protein C5C18_04810 [Rathayibacter tritici]|nr:hypothetical protein C5C21_02965 [Rathayibacter tritici]PPG08279.1 hypothetical protein C5C18_04810 [Rathayibacter tritici]